ncbi:MAG TPA: VTT domain-containing protein [Nitrospirota bacterium]|nr:VTT domain-containing protein [Nitrospirota bacterium]
MHSLNLFISFVEAHRYWGYGLLFIAMIFEGELFLTATGMLVRLQAFDFFDAFFFALSGVLSGDILWYWAGRMLVFRYPHHRITLFVVQRVKRYLPSIGRNPVHVIFLSKFIYGLNHSTLVVLGFLRIPFGRFIRIQFITSFIWSLIFLIVGYIFGSVALTITHRFQRFIILALLFLIAVVFIDYVIGRFIEKAERKHGE